MFPPLPTKPIVKNEQGESVINPMLRLIKGITLQPSLAQATQTVPAAVGAQAGTIPPVTYESPFAGYTEIFNIECSAVPSFDLFCNLSCTRYGGRYWTSRPIPYPFIVSQSGNATTGRFTFSPSFHEMAVSPMIAPQQTVSLQFFNICTTERSTRQNIEGRLIERGVNTFSNGRLIQEYNDRGRVMPYWLACDQSIKIGGLDTDFPGLNFTAGGQRTQTAIFTNKFPTTFIAVGMMVAAAEIGAGSTSPATESNKFNIRMYDRTFHELTNQPIPMNDFFSKMNQPYFFNHPFVMNRGDDFRMDAIVIDGVAVPDATVFCTLFGMSLL